MMHLTCLLNPQAVCARWWPPKLPHANNDENPYYIKVTHLKQM